MGQWMWQHRSGPFQCNKLYSHRHLFHSFTNPSSTTQLDRNTHAKYLAPFLSVDSQDNPEASFPSALTTLQGRGIHFHSHANDKQVINCVQSYHPLFIYHDSLLSSSVARSPEGMHDLFQAVLSCHKLFCPHFYFPSFYSCPALLPPSFQHFFTAVLLEGYLLLSPCA